MSGVDIDKMRKAHESHQTGGGDFLKIEEGDTLLLIHPPSREGDEWEPTEGTNFVPIRVHYGVGKNNGMAASLDPETNPIINHPWIKAELKKRKVRLTGECPIKAALEEGALDNETADNMRGSTRFLWGVTPIRYRPRKSAPWVEFAPKPTIALVGKQMFDGFMEVFYDNGDITNFAGATLVRVSKKGSGMNTKYSVTADPETVKKPYVVPKPLRAAITKSVAEGGDCDLFRVAATLIKSPSEVQAMLDGLEVETDVDDDEDEKPTRRRATAKAKGRKPVEDDEDLLDEDEEEEDEAPKRKSTTKAAAKKTSKSKVADDDDEDDEDDEDEKPLRKAIKRAKAEEGEDDEEEEDEKPAPKTKARGRKAAPPDDEDEDDEEEAKPVKRAVKKPAAAKKAPPPDEDDEDGDEDEEEDEAPPKRSAKKVAKKPVDDDEDEEDEDDEDEAPKQKKGLAKTGGKTSRKVSDDEEIGISELEDALADLDDEEEEPVKHKKSA